MAIGNPANPFALAPNPGQFSAISNGANSGSLVSQLFAGKPFSGQFAPPPASLSASAQAATSSVKNPAAPSNASVPQTPVISPAPVAQTATQGGLLYNGVPTSGAPGTTGNEGAVTQNNSTPNSQNGVQPGGVGSNLPTSTGTFTTPSGAIVDSNGNLISTAPVAPFSAATTGLLGAPGQNAAIGENSAQIQAAAGAQETKVAEEAAGLENAYGTTPGMAFPTSQGLAQNTAATAGEVEQGIAQGAATALTGTGQELTAQGQSQSALTSAGQLTQPSGNFPFVFNPATASYSVSGGDLQGAISGGVQQSLSNPTLYTALNNAITSTYGAAAAGMFQQAYIAAGGNPSIAAGQATGAQALAAAPGQGQATGEAAVIAAGGQTQAQNAITAGTAATSADSTAYQAAVQNVSKASQQYAAATGVGSNLESTLAAWTQSGLLTNVNAGLNTVAGLTSNPQYAQFSTAVTNAQAAFTAAFASVGVTPSQSTANALKELNPDSSATTIIASLNQLSSDLYAATVVPAYQQQTTYGTKLGIQ